LESYHPSNLIRIGDPSLRPALPSLQMDSVEVMASSRLLTKTANLVECIILSNIYETVKFVLGRGKLSTVKVRALAMFLEWQSGWTKQ
jgi:hypothetical protein